MDGARIYSILYNFPPPKFLAMSSQELVNDYYLKYNMQIRIGMTATLVAGFFYLIWGVQVATMLRDSEGKLTFFSYLELAGALLSGWVLGACPARWLACAHYAGSMHPDLIMLLHSQTWFEYDMTYMITMMQTTALALWIILNKKQTIFPLWVGWTTLAAGASFVTLSLIPFIPDGALSVGGVWNFFFVYGAWFILFFTIFSFYVLKELRRRLIANEE